MIRRSKSNGINAEVKSIRIQTSSSLDPIPAEEHFYHNIYILLITLGVSDTVHCSLFSFFLKIKNNLLTSYMYISLNLGQARPLSMPFLAVLGEGQAICPLSRRSKNCLFSVFLIQSLGT